MGGGGQRAGSLHLSSPTPLHGLNAPSPGTDHPPASCRCVGTVMWELHPSALGPNDGSIAIVGHSCALYPRLPGRDSDRGTPQSLSAVDACSWDAKGRWGGAAGVGTPSPGAGAQPGLNAAVAPSVQGPGEPPAGSSGQGSLLHAGKPRPCPVCTEKRPQPSRAVRRCSGRCWRSPRRWRSCRR